MPIDFRLQFKEDTNQNEVAYQDDQTAAQRISRIYGTARIGRLSNQRAVEIWTNFFYPIWKSRFKIPASKNQFDNWIRIEIRHLSEYLAKCIKPQNRMRIGLAQKFLNLFLKDLWAFQEVKEKVSILFHIPLDRILLGRITEYSERWKSWTKVVATTDATFDDRYSEYLDIQNAFRSYVNNLDGFTALDLEQLYWHKINVEQQPSADR
jgi:hypothetical protein